MSEMFRAWFSKLKTKLFLWHFDILLTVIGMIFAVAIVGAAGYVGIMLAWTYMFN